MHPSVLPPPQLPPMTRLSPEERALVAHRPVAANICWRVLRWIPGVGQAALAPRELAEVVALAAASSTEHLVGLWLQQAPALTRAELKLLRAAARTLPPSPDRTLAVLSDETVGIVLEAWRDNASG